MEARKTLLKSFINVEIVQAAAVIFVMVILFMSFKVGSFVVTREEGDVIKGDVAALRASQEKLYEQLKEYHKDQEAKLQLVRVELKQDIKNSQDLILQRMGEIRSSMLDSNKELRETIDRRMRK